MVNNNLQNARKANNKDMFTVVEIVDIVDLFFNTVFKTQSTVIVQLRGPDISDCLFKSFES